MSTITMWRLGFNKIDPAQCTKVTACFVWPVECNGRRESRSSESTSYHETWADAHAAMLAKAERKIDSARRQIDSARRQLERAQADYDRIKRMKPPVGHPGGELT